MNKVINVGEVTEKMLRRVRDDSADGAVDLTSKTIEMGVHFEHLVPYEAKLGQDEHDYKVLKSKALTNIVNILRDYIAQSKGYWQMRAIAVAQAVAQRLRYAQGTSEIDNQISVLATEATAKISAEIAPLVKYLFRALGALPFREDIDKLREALEYEFRGPARLGQSSAEDAELELTFRQAGTVVTPFTASYPYSDPVDGLVIANQNIFGWVGNYVFRNAFYREGGTITAFKKFAQALSYRLDIEGNQKYFDALPENLSNLMRLHIDAEKRDIDNTDSVFNQNTAMFNAMIGALGFEEKSTEEIRKIQQRIVAQINIIKPNLVWLRSFAGSIAVQSGGAVADKQDILRLNEEINNCILTMDLATLGPKFHEAFTRIIPMKYDALSWLMQAGKASKDAAADILASVNAFNAILVRDNLRNEATRKVSREERQKLSQRLYDVVLRTSEDGKSHDADLDRAFFRLWRQIVKHVPT